VGAVALLLQLALSSRAAQTTIRVRGADTATDATARRDCRRRQAVPRGGDALEPCGQLVHAKRARTRVLGLLPLRVDSINSDSSTFCQRQNGTAHMSEFGHNGCMMDDGGGGGGRGRGAGFPRFIGPICGGDGGPRLALRTPIGAVDWAVGAVGALDWAVGALDWAVGALDLAVGAIFPASATATA
jgi:hypothetical protein